MIGHVFVAALTAVALLLVQSPPVATTPASPKPQTITVRGCISGRSITDLASPGTSPSGIDSRVGSSFRLKGSKAMMKEVEEHNGHGDEITGVVTLSRDASARVIAEKKKGKARVYAGKRTADRAEQGSDAGEIDVKTLTHLQDHCQ